MNIPNRLFGPALACCALVGCKANPDQQPEAYDPSRPLAVDDSHPDDLRRDHVRAADANAERRRLEELENDPQRRDELVRDDMKRYDQTRRYDDVRDARDVRAVDARSGSVRYDAERGVLIAQGDAVTLPEVASQSDPIYHMLDVRADRQAEVEWHSGDGVAVARSETLRERASQTDPAYEMSDVRGDRGVAEASARRGSAMTMTTRRATAVLTPVGDSRVQGSLAFEPVDGGVRVRGRITGLTPGAHGFHVHEYGDVSDRTAGKAAGEHYGPGGTPHGRPDDHRRHAGDLGNIVADANGVANVDFVDPKLRLDGEHSIVGRSIVVHAGEDKFTQPSGDAGARVAVGVIGVAADDVAPMPRETERR